MHVLLEALDVDGWSGERRLLGGSLSWGMTTFVVDGTDGHNLLLHAGFRWDVGKENT